MTSVYIYIYIYIYIYNKKSGTGVEWLVYNQEDTGSKPVFAIFFFR